MWSGHIKHWIIEIIVIVGHVAGVDVGEEGKIVTIKLIDIRESDDDVGECQTNHTEDDEEEDGVVLVEPLKHLCSYSSLFVSQSISGCEALGQENTGECCPDVLTLVSGLHQEVSQDVVTDDHEEDDTNTDEVKVAAEKSNDESSDRDVKNVKHESSQPFHKLYRLLGCN